MAAELLVKGVVIGLIFGIPVGAVGTLVVQKTLEGGFSAGLFTGLGSVSADILYACAGIFGISLLTDFLQKYEVPVSLTGACLIIVYGVLIFRKKNVSQDRSVRKLNRAAAKGYTSAFAIAVINPATIVSFMVAFSAFGITGKYTLRGGLQLVFGIFSGTSLWWILLSALVSRFKRRMTDRIYGRMNRILGILMILFGMAMLLRSLLYGKK